MMRKKTPRSREMLPAKTKRGMKYLEGIEVVDRKDHELLRKFTTERGKIIPRRLTGASAKQQRQVTRAIRRARVIGLLP